MKLVMIGSRVNRARSALATLSVSAMLFGQALHFVAAPTVELLRDPWGTPHVFAVAEADGFFGLGYAAAEDRLLQMELIRRKAAGRLAEVFGPDWVEGDRLFTNSEGVDEFRLVPRLSAVRNGGTVSIAWEGVGQLQSAPAADGPWATISNAINPHVSSDGSTEFFRVKVQ